MTVLSSPNFLRNLLWADAASCLGGGVLQLVVSGAMAAMLGLPEALLNGTGIFLVAYAAAVAFVATRQPVPRGLVWILVGGNFGWALACVVLLASGAFPVTAVGVAYVLVQALTVVVLAELQWLGLRHTPAGWV